MAVNIGLMQWGYRWVCCQKEVLDNIRVNWRNRGWVPILWMAGHILVNTALSLFINHLRNLALCSAGW